MTESFNKHKAYLILQKYKYRITVRIWNKMKFKDILLKFVQKLVQEIYGLWFG